MTPTTCLRTAYLVLAVAVLAWAAPSVLAEDAKTAAAPAAAAKPAEPSYLLSYPPMDEFMAKAANPVPWLKWGADVRVREEYIDDGGINNHAPRTRSDEASWQRYRERFWATVTPAKDYDFFLRITHEGRHFSAPHGTRDFDEGEVLVDNLYGKFTNVLGTPLSMTLGRQDLPLGDGWLVLDATPLDGSRTIFFDAARFTYDFKDAKTTVDVIYLDQTASHDRWINALHDLHGYVMEQDERGLILWLSNKAVARTEINGYYIYKHMDRVLANGDDGFIHTIGGRIAGEAGDHWKYRAEGATQWGDLNDRYLRAFGFNSRLTYLCKDKVDNQFRTDYEFLSGDDPDSPGTNEAFQLLWGRWPRFSEYFLYAWAYSREGRVGDVTNLHRLTFGWSCKPADRLECAADYHLLFADESSMRGRANFNDAGSFRGQLLALLVQYTFSKHMKAHVLTEFFFPGNYYSNEADAGAFLRGEVFFTW